MSSKKQLREEKKARATKIKNYVLLNPNLTLGVYAEKLGVDRMVVSGVLATMKRWGNETEKNASTPKQILSLEKNRLTPTPTTDVKVIQKFIIDNNNLHYKEIMERLNISSNVYRANSASITKLNNKLKKSAKVASGVFVHEKSPIKETFYRNPIIEKINQSSLKSGSIISLPAENFTTEKRIFNEISKKFEFYCVEHKDDVYFKLLGNLAKNKFKMVVYPTELSRVLDNAKENSIAHLIADYCGQLHTYEKEITDAIKRNIVRVDGVIAITINKRITGAENHKFYDEMIALNGTEMHSNICKVEKAFKIFLERLCGFDYKLETYLDYHSKKENGGKCANMMLAIIRRIK